MCHGSIHVDSMPSKSHDDTPKRHRNPVAERLTMSKEDLEEIVVLSEENVEVETDKAAKQKRWRETSLSYASSESKKPVSYRRFSSPKPPSKKLAERRSSGILRVDANDPKDDHSRKKSRSSLCQEPHSPAPSSDRLSVTFAMDDDKGRSRFAQQFKLEFGITT